MEDLFDYFRNLKAEKLMVSLVGAGGKTTLLYFLSKKFACQGLRVLLTTTTQIYTPSKSDGCSSIFVNKNTVDIDCKPGEIVCFGSKISGEKMIGIPSSIANELFESNQFDVILIEADGSKMRPIKVPASHEPVIPSATTHVIGVMGMDALGNKVDHGMIHRMDQFCLVTGLKEGDIIGEEAYLKIINTPVGLFKGSPLKSELILFLNKASHCSKVKEAKNIIRYALERGIKNFERGYWQ